MSSFFRRLKYYGIGFGIGLFFVFFFFQNRGCSWLPANRVKNSFLDRVIVLPDAEAKKLKANQLDKQDVIEVLNDGEVVFDKSKKEGDTKVYLLEKNFPGKGKVSFFFTLPKESYFTEVHFTAKAGQQVSHKMAYKVKNTEVGVGEILHFPNDENLIFVDTAQLLTCQQDALGLISPLEIFRKIKKTGKVNFEKTNYAKRPKAEHYIQFLDKNQAVIGTKSIWYKNKITITAFEIPFKTNCEEANEKKGVDKITF